MQHCACCHVVLPSALLHSITVRSECIIGMSELIYAHENSSILHMQENKHFYKQLVHRLAYFRGHVHVAATVVDTQSIRLSVS
jgi:hypothetical protein